MRRAVPLSLCVCLIALSSTIPHAQNTPKPPAGYTRATKDTKKQGPGAEVLLTSDDGGKTWIRRAELPGLQGRVFSAGGRLYYLSPGAGLPASRSDDRGETWAAPVMWRRASSRSFMAVPSWWFPLRPPGLWHA